jgi:hypothetical protein
MEDALSGLDPHRSGTIALVDEMTDVVRPVFAAHHGFRHAVMQNRRVAVSPRLGALVVLAARLFRRDPDVEHTRALEDRV